MNKPHILHVVESVCRLGLGILFVYSALAKVSDPYDFAFSVMRYRVLPDFTIGLFALTMPMLELLAGLTMLSTQWLRESALLITGMLALFIVALVQALARGLEISCGCFGVPSVGGREEIVMALIRDMVLIVPAAWLMFRRNGWIWPLAGMPKGGRIACLCGIGALFSVWLVKDMWDSGAFAPGLLPDSDDSLEVATHPLPVTDDSMESGIKGQGARQELAVSSGPIRPGEWNADFEGVLAKAERECLPMLLLYVSSGCGNCTRLEECMVGETFRQWSEDRAPLMTLVRAGSRMSPSRVVRAAQNLVREINKDIYGTPYVCVYWPQNGITNGVAFCGRRGMMGGRRDKLLVVELMSALDRALGERWTAGRRTLESIIRAATAQITVRTEGVGGSVTMMPENGLLEDGKRVELVAHPTEESAFLDWRMPDGSLAGIESKLVVHRNMPVGCYTARFKKRSQCQPPLLTSSAEASIRVKTNEFFSHEIRVAESSRPVKFQMKRPVAGVTVDPVTGVVTGKIPRPATNIVEIAVIGYDLGKTEKTVRLKIETFQKRFLRQKKSGD